MLSLAPFLLVAFLQETTAPPPSARESLEPVAGLISLTPPAMQAPLLLEAGRVWARHDRAAALTLLEQAAAAAAPPDRDSLLGEIAAEMVVLDAGRATDLLALLPVTPASRPTDAAVVAHVKVISALAADPKRRESALELAQSSGAMRFLSVASSLLRHLPKNHPARAGILAAAVPALRDVDAVSGSVQFLKAHLDEFPPESAGAARAAVFAALEEKPSRRVRTTMTISRAEGSVHLVGPQHPAAFEYAAFLRSLDPKAWQAYLDRQPEFASLIERYPEGEASFTKGAKGVSKMMTIGGPPGELATTGFEARAATTNLRNATMLNLVATRSLEAGFEAATGEAATDEERATFLSVGLHRIRKDHAEQPCPWMDRLVHIAGDIRNAETQAQSASNLIEAAHELKCPAAGRKAAESAFEAARRTRVRERARAANEPAPVVLFWASTALYRRAAYAAARHDPSLIGQLLAETQDPELLLWLRLESARAWSGLPPPNLSIRFHAPEGA